MRQAIVEHGRRGTGGPPVSPQPPDGGQAMKRWVPLLLVPFVLVPIGLAQDAANLSEHPDRLRQFQRNYALIESLVQGGVRLAAANQPLQRVEHCIALLRSLRDALRQA